MGEWHAVTLWSNLPDGGLREVGVPEVQDLQVWTVVLGYVSLYGGPGADLLRTRVTAPLADVELGDVSHPSAGGPQRPWGRQPADECRSTEAARQRRRVEVEGGRHERRTTRQSAGRTPSRR